MIIYNNNIICLPESSVLPSPAPAHFLHFILKLPCLGFYEVFYITKCKLIPLDPKTAICGPEPKCRV